MKIQPPYLIKKTKTTPMLYIDYDNGTVTIEGHSYPENAESLFRPFVSTLENFLYKTDKPIVFEFNVPYLNTSSTKFLYDILELLNKATENNKNILLNWYYDIENENTLELGTELLEDSNFQYKLLPLQ